MAAAERCSILDRGCLNATCEKVEVYGIVQKARSSYGATDRGSHLPTLHAEGGRSWSQETGGKVPWQRCVGLAAASILLASTFYAGYKRPGAGSQVVSQLEAAPRRTLTLFHIADVHVEPFFNAEGASSMALQTCRRAECIPYDPGDKHCIMDLSDPAKYEFMPLAGCDPPLTLLESALDQMRVIDPNPDAILFSGDCVGHYLESASGADHIQRQVLRRFYDAFPNTPVLFSPGNNDLVPDGTITQSELNRLWSLMELQPNTLMGFAREDSTSKAKDTFLKGGYYSYRNESLGVRFLVLNSLLYSPNYHNQLDNPRPEVVAMGQLDWLEDHLAEALDLGESVVILGHNPPGIFYAKNDWAPSYLERFLEVCSAYPEVIAAQLFGHHSKEMMRSLAPDVAVLVSVGLTPGGGHGRKTAVGKYRQAVNPGFSHLTVVDGLLSEYRAHYLDLAMVGLDTAQEVDLPSGVPATTADLHKTKKHKGRRKAPSKAGKGGPSKGETHKQDPVVLAPRGPPAPSGHLQHLQQSPGTLPGTVVAALRGQWKQLYSFTDTYNVPDVSPSSIYLARRKIMRESRYGATYAAISRGYYAANHEAVCDVGALSPEDEEACLQRRCMYDTTIYCRGVDDDSVDSR